MDRVKDHLLHSLISCPGLSVLEVINAGMSSEEWVEDACLVFLNELVVCWDSFKTWKIGTSEDHARDSECKCHTQIRVDIVICDLAVTSPHSSVTLRPEES